MTGRRLAAIAAALALSLAFAPAARAERVIVGLFAPSAPFPSTAARVELATRLGDQLGKGLGAMGAGKVFARAADFAAAVKQGEITIALVDATYLAVAGGSYTIVAGAVRGGETEHAWQLVARSGGGGRDGATPSSEPIAIAALRGKRVLVPANGGREADLALNALLGGALEPGYFAAIDIATDTASALAALSLGKADAAIVPSGETLPPGTAVVATLPALSGPVLVVYGAPNAQRQAQIAAAAAGFQGDATVAALRPVDADVVRAIARRLATEPRRGPFALPAFRLLVGDLVAGRALAIPRTPATAFVATP